MSDAIKRDYSFTVRLSPEEKTVLERLADRLDLDKSATVREALRRTASCTPTLAGQGQFVPLLNPSVTFPVRLNGKAVDER